MKKNEYTEEFFFLKKIFYYITKFTLCYDMKMLKSVEEACNAL